MMSTDALTTVLRTGKHCIAPTTTVLSTDALSTVLRKGKHCIIHSFLAPTIKSCIEDYLELRRNAPLHEWEQDPEYPEDEFTITMIANTAHTRYAVNLRVTTIADAEREEPPFRVTSWLRISVRDMRLPRGFQTNTEAFLEKEGALDEAIADVYGIHGGLTEADRRNGGIRRHVMDRTSLEGNEQNMVLYLGDFLALVVYRRLISYSATVWSSSG